MKHFILRLIRFGLVGGTAAFVYAICSYILIWNFNVNEILASTIAYLIAIPISFIGQKYFTFSSDGKVKTEASKFLVLQLFCLVLATLTTSVTSKVLFLHPNIGIIVVCIVIPLMSYFLMSFVVFREK